MAPKRKPIDQGPTETEKAMFLLEIEALNKKIARCQNTVQTFKQENLQLQQLYQDLDREHCDVITFLKKTLSIKNDEVTELKDTMRGLIETREIETKEFKQRIAELDQNFVIMKNQLSTENKLLSGRLNTLEDFRAIRENLMKKFENQDQELKDHELKYKRLVYDAEKKLIIGKDNLKKDMEKRLLQLALDFQNASERRITASTHRILRENVAVKRELEAIVQSQKKLENLVDKCKDQERKAMIEKEQAERERNIAILKSVTQLKVIERLTASVRAMKKEYANNKRMQTDVEELDMEMKYLQDRNELLSMRVRMLEQEVHFKDSSEYNSKVNSHKIILENEKLKNIIRDAMYALDAVFKINLLGSVDLEEETNNKNVLLQKLASIFAQYNTPLRGESESTLFDSQSIYKQGIFEIVPSKESIKSKRTIKSTGIVRKDSVPAPYVEDSKSDSISLPTIPSTHLVPYTEPVDELVVESIPSFTRSSGLSEETESVVIEEEDNIEEKLTKSKIAMQESALKDLQSLSRTSSSRGTFEIIGGKSLSGKSVSVVQEQRAESDVHGEGAAAEDKPNDSHTEEQEAT